ncbi:MAG: GntR family transcriptional regulator, partial [Clostridia bacterium]|nr:GntR family transcriptional regulator [Clostridia bacterium]
MIQIDYQDKRPLYEQVIEKIQNLIIRNALETDTKLPSVRALAIELSINPNTIQKAYAELERMGFIYTVKGRGNFVAAKRIWMLNETNQVMGEIEKAVLQAKELGIAMEDVEESVKRI